MELVIKNMVCARCMESVRKVFDDLRIPVTEIGLGAVTLPSGLSTGQETDLRRALQEKGFELLDDKRTRLINQIKSFVIEFIHYQDEPVNLNLSAMLADRLHFDYAYLSRLFSTVEGRTIENFVIAQKVERIKELLTYDELTLSEIAFQMQYSSAAHLSSQFRKTTGMSPSEFRKLQKQERRALDQL